MELISARRRPTRPRVHGDNYIFTASFCKEKTLTNWFTESESALMSHMASGASSRPRPYSDSVFRRKGDI
jgi:hypothetical protein